MKKILFILFMFSVSAIYAQRTIDLPIATEIDTLDRFTTLYRPSAPTTLYNVTFKTMRDYFWSKLNRWTGINYFDSTTVFKDSVIANKYFDLTNRNDADSNKHSPLILPKKLDLMRIGSVSMRLDTIGMDAYRIAYRSAIDRIDSVATLRDIRNIVLSGVDTSKGYIWTGLHQFTRDSIKINGLWYDLPATRIANSVLYDSLGNGILKWKTFTSGSTIDTTKISYLAKNETFTGIKTLTGINFATTGYLSLPNTPQTTTGRFWYRDGKVRIFDGSVMKALIDSTYFSGTTSQIAYWNGTNSLASLTTATYPSLAELSYVKGVTSAIQTQFTGKLSTSLTNTYLFVGNGSNIATAVAMSGDATIANTGAVTVANDSHDHTTTTISGLDAANDISSGLLAIARGGTNRGSYVAGKYLKFDGTKFISSGFDSTSWVTLATNQAITGGKSMASYLTFTSTGSLGLPTLAQTTKGYLWYQEDGTYTVGEVRGYNVNGAFSLIRDNETYSNPSWVASLSENKISFTDITTGNASTTKHGYLPKLNNSATQFLNGQGSWATPTATIDQTAAYSWTGLHKWTSALLSSDTTGAYFNSYTATSGADIKGLTSYVYTSSNPTANKIYGGMFNAVGSGTSGGSGSYGIYANASGSNTSYAGYFTAKGSSGDNYAIYADASSSSYNAYAAYFANGLVYIANGFLNVAGKFAVNTNGQITLINNTSPTSGYVPIGNGSHYEPVDLFARNNAWTGSTTFTPESFSYNTTLDASGKTSISAGGSGNGTTTTISNGVAGQILILINTSSSFTWTLNETGNINLAGSADYVMGQSDTITLIYESGSAKWLETARSNN